MAVVVPLWHEEGKKRKGERKKEVKGAAVMFRGSNPSAMGEATVGHRHDVAFGREREEWRHKCLRISEDRSHGVLISRYAW
jgi:hypothetical protein